jgi:hypothetical protein
LPHASSSSSERDVGEIDEACRERVAPGEAVP